MKIIVQVSKNASVKVLEHHEERIDFGYTLLVGFSETDTFSDVDKMIKKLLKLRVFPDERGKQNLNIMDVNGSILSISQFTLYANLKDGNRPSYVDAMKYEKASAFYDYFNQELQKCVPVKTGVFGSEMYLTLTNVGPITIIMDSADM